MATTVGQHTVATFTSPVNGTTPIDANTVRGNDNTLRTSYNDHDSDTGIHVQSSAVASRPVAGTAGRKWITVDVGGDLHLWYDTGTTWEEVGNSGVEVLCIANSDLTAGDVVKIIGFNNGQSLPIVDIVDSADDVGFGVVDVDIANGSTGYVVNTGVARDFDTSSFTVGDVLYKDTSGGFTTTKPTSGEYQPCAIVLRSNANNGALYVEFSAPRIVERSDNTASTVVLRDASGNFAAGTITAGALTSTGLVTFASLKGTGATTVTNILDEDNMASNSATALATQQSIKAYVDSQVATVDTLAEILVNGNTSGGTNLIMSAGDTLTVNTIAETTVGAGVTIDSVLLKDDVVNATDIEVSTISANDGVQSAVVASATGVMTIASSVLTTTDINGGTIDGTTIGGATPAVGTFTTANATTVDTTNLEVTTLKAKDGTSAGSIADATGVVTLASSVLTTTDINGGTVDGAVIGGASAAAGTFTTLTANTNLTIAGTTTVNGVIDDDTMATASATKLATSESIKAYVDSQVTAQDLDFAGDSGTGQVDLDSQTFTIAGTSGEIETSASGQTITVGLPTNVTIAGDLFIPNGQVLADGGGTVSAPSYSFDNDTDTGMYLSSTGVLSLAAGAMSGFEVHSNPGGAYGYLSITPQSGGTFASLGTTAYSRTVYLSKNLYYYKTHPSSFSPYERINWAYQSGDTASNQMGGALINGTNGSVSWGFYAVPITTGAGNIPASLNQIATITTNGTDSTAGQIRLVNGTAALPSYSFLNDLNTGIYSAGADTLGFATGGVQRATIASNGNVGIGTTSPNLSGFGATETVLSLKEKASGGYSVIELQSSGVTGTNRFGEIRFLNSSAASPYGFAGIRATRDGADNSSAFGFWTSSSGSASEKMHIDSTGNVGIGTASPTSTLTVIHPNSGAGGIELATNQTNTTDKTARIKTTHYNTAEEPVTVFVTNNQSSGNLINWGGGSGLENAATEHKFFTASNNTTVTGTERMRITNTGSVSINSASVVSSEKFLVKSTGGSNAWTQISWNNSGTGDNKFIEFGTETAYAARGSISYNRSGGLVAYNTTSDVRLKKNIADSVDAGDKIDSIKVRQFDWVETGNHLDYGFIAQELHQFVPHAVTIPEDDEKMWSVDYSKLVPMLTKEIQSLRSRIASLEMN